MMSIEAICDLREEQAKVARSKRYVPRVFFDATDADKHYGAIPNIGDYRPKGWHLEEHQTVDKTGWGGENEPALTLRGYRAWIGEHLTDSSGFAIIEEGQFQIVVGRFVPTQKP